MKKGSRNNFDFSLILPCYNESEHLIKSVDTILSTLKNSEYSYEIILIDDKSTDDTAGLLKKISKRNRDLKIFFHNINQGRGATVVHGIRKALGDIVGFIDIDLEVSPKYITTLVNLIKNNKADIVIGSRRETPNFLSLNNLMRIVMSNGYITLTKLFLNLPIRDTESGYKFFLRSKILKILPSIKNKHWFFDTEIIARSLMKGLKIMEVPVKFIRNNKKTSTVKPLSDSIRHFVALYRFKRSIKS